MIQVERPDFFFIFYVKILTKTFTDNEWFFYNVIIINVGYYSLIKKNQTMETCVNCAFHLSKVLY